MGSLPETYNEPNNDPVFFAYAHMPKCRSFFPTLLFFPFNFLFIAALLSFFAWTCNCGWLTFKERDKFNLQKEVSE